MIGRCIDCEYVCHSVTETMTEERPMACLIGCTPIDDGCRAYRLRDAYRYGHNCRTCFWYTNCTHQGPHYGGWAEPCKYWTCAKGDPQWMN